MDPGQDDLEQITLNIVTRLNINKRLQRQKDKLENYKLHNVIGRGAFGKFDWLEISPPVNLYSCRRSSGHQETSEEVSAAEKASLQRVSITKFYD